MSIAAKYLAELEKILDRKEQADRYRDISEKAFTAIEGFYDENDGLYYSFIKDGKKEGLHAYSLAVVLYAGIKSDRAKHIAGILVSEDTRIVPCTTAALQFYYDVIIKYAKNGLDFVWKDIENRFGKMILAGATSLWETDLGDAVYVTHGLQCRVIFTINTGFNRNCD